MSLILLFQGRGPFPPPSPSIQAFIAGDVATIARLAGERSLSRFLAGESALIRPLEGDRDKVTIH